MRTIAQKLHFSEIMQEGNSRNRIIVCQHLVHIHVECAQLTKVSTFTKMKFLKVKVTKISC